MNPLISIIIPIYKVEKYLRKCIESVINQTYKNLEIILIDDGSPDNCNSICDEYQKIDDRIIVVHQKNRGVSNARNIGLNIASGEYIGFVDGDDYIARDMYETLYNVMQENNAQMSVCNFYIEKQGEMFIQHKIDNGIKVFNQQEAIREMLLDRIIRGYLWTKLYKKECFHNLRFPEGKNYEDVAISIKVLENIEKVVYINTPKYYYLYRDDSIDREKSKKSITDVLEIAYERYQYVKEKYPGLAKYNIYSFIFRIIGEYYVMKHKWYLDLYYNIEYTDIIRGINKDFEQLKPEVVPLMNNEAVGRAWNELVAELYIGNTIEYERKNFDK